ncbi:hypothetical protein BKA58DRAFT_200519 [Alternaria rosae]|uniref:uncharacterized protein n=1 Tax=Alternaria rosae TaxID=1187941 RepID=UPI001E8E9002|nr:uncharacterized protein BKA58DRAFT_200519 [Alternaria rosae]KAH6868766.1 hypothetical protein BKA58DRAFT_200519 [Alternaria rosae]
MFTATAVDRDILRLWCYTERGVSQSKGVFPTTSVVFSDWRVWKKPAISKLPWKFPTDHMVHGVLWLQHFSSTSLNMFCRVMAKSPSSGSWSVGHGWVGEAEGRRRGGGGEEVETRPLLLLLVVSSSASSHLLACSSVGHPDWQYERVYYSDCAYALHHGQPWLAFALFVFYSSEFLVFYQLSPELKLLCPGFETGLLLVPSVPDGPSLAPTRFARLTGFR